MKSPRKKWPYLLAFVLMMTIVINTCKAAILVGDQANTQTDETQTATTEPASEPVTEPATEPGDTQEPDKTINTSGTPDEVDKECLVLSKPVVTCTKRTASKLTLKWKKVSNAITYHVYRSKTKTGKYTLLSSTRKLTYTDKKVKSKHTYYYKVYAEGKSDQGTRILSKYSKILKATTRKKVTKTAYVGDSVMSGMDVYKIIRSSGKKVIYKIGVSPQNFYNGAPMDQLLNYKPDRMYIMLGMNCLVGSPSGGHMDTQISYYKKIIKACKKANPDMQIIVLPVTPTSPSATVKNSNINKFNSKLKSMAKSLKVHYYDCTSVLKNSNGTLKKECSAGDGIHLTPAAYRAFKKKLDSYGKKLN